MTNARNDTVKFTEDQPEIDLVVNDYEPVVIPEFFPQDIKEGILLYEANNGACFISNLHEGMIGKAPAYSVELNYIGIATIYCTILSDYAGNKLAEAHNYYSYNLLRGFLAATIRYHSTHTEEFEKEYGKV